MKNAIIIHGMPDKEHYLRPGALAQSESHWLPWLKNELDLNNIKTDVPEMPKPYEPNYENWKAFFEQFPINNETVLIGHSAGAGFLIRYLAENNITVSKVILVAPWLDPEKYLKTLNCGEFFNFEFNTNVANKILNQVNNLDIFYSTDDDENILKTVEILKQNFDENEKVIYHEFANRGHFTAEPGYDNDTIPEVLNICLQ